MSLPLNHLPWYTVNVQSMYYIQTIDALVRLLLCIKIKEWLTCDFHYHGNDIYDLIKLHCGFGGGWHIVRRHMINWLNWTRSVSTSDSTLLYFYSHYRILYQFWGKILRERKDIMPINNWCWQLPFGCAKSQKVSRGSRWFETNYITRRFLYCSKEPSIKDVQLFQGKGGLMLQEIKS